MVDIHLGEKTEKTGDYDSDGKPHPSLAVAYNRADGSFSYSDKIEDFLGHITKETSLWDAMWNKRMCSYEESRHIKELAVKTGMNGPEVVFEELYLKTVDGSFGWFRLGFVSSDPSSVCITITDMSFETFSEQILEFSRRDSLTGLYNREAFLKAAGSMVTGDTGESYAMVYFDVIRFKAINEIFGVDEGDRLLRYIAQAIVDTSDKDELCCRAGSDRFMIFSKQVGDKLEARLDRLMRKIEEYNLATAVSCSIGIYVAKKTDADFNIFSMVDRAVLAQSAIKGKYSVRYNYYNDKLRNAMLDEQEILGMMEEAVTKEQFTLYYQPQFDHSTGMLMGAEALVRWKHPEKGLISPGIFIPVFEKNGFITKLDFYVFEKACIFVKKCIDSGLPVVPVSTNFSRVDIYQNDFAKKLEAIRERIQVPAKYLRVEITESAIVGSSQYVNEVIGKLHDYGYIVEMDDFGSGYSSLNVLKDIDLDVIKLDMKFMLKKSDNKRGGTILSSVVRMAKWLGLPVIAEGVETIEQADFLRSIGCNYIQGYLYSRPVPEEDYIKTIKRSQVGSFIPQYNLVDSLSSGDFWNPESIETIIFSSFVGGAAILSYHKGELETLRVNKKYLEEICMNLSEKDFIETDPGTTLDDENRRLYISTIEKAIETGKEQTCETWRTLKSKCCGEERVCVRSSIQIIGRSSDSFLVYSMIRNITSEMEYIGKALDDEKRFKIASEQVNIYYWEYTVATKQMRPCFRCMRDLGLPPVLENYPDSAIEMGVFPPEVADMYRDWHVQIANGVKELEAVMPLTKDRIPFRVRYTTEFDSNGRPVKAYGSAALIV